MTSLWEWWVERTQRQIDARPAALVRILTGASVAADQLWVYAIGLVPLVYRDYRFGGIGDGTSPYFFMDDLFGPIMGGTHAWAITVVCMLCVMVGFKSRLFTIIGVIAYAQLLLGFWMTWHGGGKIAREVLLILLFAPAAHQVWSVDVSPPSARR